MVEEGEDVSAFENFSVEDAGGDASAPKPSKEGNAVEASEPAEPGAPLGATPPDLVPVPLPPEVC